MTRKALSFMKRFSVLVSLLLSCTVAFSAQQPPAAPVQHTATLTWTPDTATVAGYNVYRGTVSGGPYTKINSVAVTAAKYVDNTVKSGQTYYYVITSVNAAGAASGYSKQVTAVVPSP
jgi:fibronectin type 3 domain-containing protein